MQYQSTRDAGLRVTAAEAIVRGLAPQSGLFVPESFPRADLEAWRQLSYPELAEKVLAGYLTDYSADFLRKAAQATYGEAFGGKAGCTVKVRERPVRAGAVAWAYLRVQRLRFAADAETAGGSQAHPAPR